MFQYTFLFVDCEVYFSFNQHITLMGWGCILLLSLYVCYSDILRWLNTMYIAIVHSKRFVVATNICGSYKAYITSGTWKKSTPFSCWHFNTVKVTSWKVCGIWGTDVGSWKSLFRNLYLAFSSTRKQWNLNLWNRTCQLIFALLLLYNQ